MSDGSYATLTPKLQETLSEMRTLFVSDPEHAVRSQSFIKRFHGHIASELRTSLTPAAIKAGVKVVEEAKIFGSYKSKDVDVAVIHPTNGPLMMVGVRSQMSSVGKNVLTYYQDIVGEAISLQERFPMTTVGYAYIHPLKVVPWTTKKGTETKAENPNHARFARMYASISGRDDRLYKHQTGTYDQFSYSVVDFHSDPVGLRDDIVSAAVPEVDMSIATFVPRLISTFHVRNIWMDDIFISPDSGEYPLEDVDVATKLDSLQ
ncbi:hypothetical protein [Arthrobacter sp. zg-Y238]|uniref:hypothetical protein n=1 Tax=Arthrobacter sp. zg-Y238 TaxID=2964614 RepID=UPI0021057BD6|nr:hypothetical protein [Arthrobacter sp. zg-Y238]MCQ1954129.1 hypothetical protein [Arthrobacter sp. zg-Y238]